MGYPYGQPGYGYAPPAYGYLRPPGGGSAITAAVLALIVGLLGSGGVVFGLVAAVNAKNKVYDYGYGARVSAEVPVYVYGMVGVGALSAFLWLLGAILLFRRSTAGRVILIIMSSLSVIGIVVSMATANPYGAVIGILPLTILILVSVSSTGRWIAARRAPHPYPQQYPYPPAPAYGQPPYYPHY